MTTVPPSLTRVARLVGPEPLERLTSARVIIFGVGGVGSWAVEALVRSGVGHVTIVDGDRVCPSNINRQLPATASTVGRPKVEALRERLLDIRPEADITALPAIYNKETADTFALSDYDIVIDAIDSLDCKALLLRRAVAEGCRVFSSMGAACKTDATLIRTADLWRVKGCALGAALRHLLRHDGGTQPQGVTCVYSEERHANLGPAPDGDPGNGTLMHVTATFGLFLASMAINALLAPPPSEV